MHEELLSMGCLGKKNNTHNKHKNKQKQQQTTKNVGRGFSFYSIVAEFQTDY